MILLNVLINNAVILQALKFSYSNTMGLKYLFYIVVILFLYRTLFRPKVIVEHRHFYDKKNPKPKKTNNNDFTDYEEVK